MEASGSAMNRIVYRGFPAPTPLPDGRNFGIREAILIQAILCFGYCGLVIRVLTSNLPAPAATKWGSQTGLGVAAALIILGYGDGMFAGLGDWVFAQSWTFLRAPMFATLAFSFACYAAAFRWAA
ncbi:hypothetical protein [Rhodoblastus sp.]|uniref:hypothetical protein n=1 Tax=Rhodoblastus sp. TaxID=1962975 RepID=UPI003F9513F9